MLLQELCRAESNSCKFFSLTNLVWISKHYVSKDLFFIFIYVLFACYDFTQLFIEQFGAIKSKPVEVKFQMTLISL